MSSPRRAKRQMMKEGARAAIASAGDDIDLDTQFCWCIKGIAQAEPFIRNLPLLLPFDAILYFEGCSVSRDVAGLYEARPALNPVPVVRDTIFPAPQVFHVAFSQEIISRLADWAAERPSNELFDHIKAYRERSLLFTFHDAFSGVFLISEHVAETAVSEFCRSLNVSYQRELNESKRNPEVLRHFLDLLENAHQSRMARLPWWKRIWWGVMGR